MTGLHTDLSINRTPLQMQIRQYQKQNLTAQHCYQSFDTNENTFEIAIVWKWSTSTPTTRLTVPLSNQVAFVALPKPPFVSSPGYTIGDNERPALDCNVSNSLPNILLHSDSVHHKTKTVISSAVSTPDIVMTTGRGELADHYAMHTLPWSWSRNDVTGTHRCRVHQGVRWCEVRRQLAVRSYTTRRVISRRHRHVGAFQRYIERRARLCT